jgi:hypothetical protein
MLSMRKAVYVYKSYWYIPGQGLVDAGKTHMDYLEKESGMPIDDVETSKMLLDVYLQKGWVRVSLISNTELAIQVYRITLSVINTIKSILHKLKLYRGNLVISDMDDESFQQYDIANFLGASASYNQRRIAAMGAGYFISPTGTIYTIDVGHAMWAVDNYKLVMSDEVFQSIEDKYDDYHDLIWEMVNYFLEHGWVRVAISKDECSIEVYKQDSNTMRLVRMFVDTLYEKIGSRRVVIESSTPSMSMPEYSKDELLHNAKLDNKLKMYCLSSGVE